MLISAYGSHEIKKQFISARLVAVMALLTKNDLYNNIIGII